jgi:uncharacterized protein
VTRPHTKSEPSDLPLAIRRLPGRSAICRLGPHEVIPPWAVNSRGFLSITRTQNELSIVVEEDAVPPHIKPVQHGWALLRVVGQLDFSHIGILARLTGALAEAQVTVFAVSSYETDYLLVPAKQAKAAEEALGRVAKIE